MPILPILSWSSFEQEKNTQARHLHMASHELGDLLGEAEPFQKLLTHPFMAGGAQHLGVEEGR